VRLVWGANVAFPCFCSTTTTTTTTTSTTTTTTLNATELAANNITATDLKEQNATASDLLAKGFTPTQLHAAGYTLDSLADAGVEASVLAALVDDGSTGSGGAVAAVLLLLLLAGVCGYFWYRRRTNQQHKDDADQAIAALDGGGMVEMMDNPLSTLRRKKVTPNPAEMQNNAGLLGRQRHVVVNNAFSIPFDDAGDTANDDDAVLAAAASASGHVLVTSTDGDESSAPIALPDYDPAGAGEVDAAQHYQNVDNTPWEGAVMQGPRDYENAPSTTVDVSRGKRGGVRTATNRTTSTSSTVTVVATPSRTTSTSSTVTVVATPSRTTSTSSTKTVATPSRTTSTSSNTLERYENVPVFRKTVRRGEKTSPRKAATVRAEDGVLPPVPKKSTAKDQQSADEESDAYEAVEVQTLSQPESEGYEVVEVRKTRTHLPGCKCGGDACKLAPVWWCDVCGSEATGTFTMAEAEACEFNHRTLQVSALRRPADDLETYAEADEDEAGAGGGGGGRGGGGRPRGAGR
jgi:hypothetical protein